NTINEKMEIIINNCVHDAALTTLDPRIRRPNKKVEKLKILDKNYKLFCQFIRKTSIALKKITPGKKEYNTSWGPPSHLEDTRLVNLWKKLLERKVRVPNKLNDLVINNWLNEKAQKIKEEYRQEKIRLIRKINNTTDRD